MDAVDRLGPRLVGVLRRLAEALDGAEAPFAVIGATAFLLHGVDLRRTTRDLDVAIAMVGGLDAVRPVLHRAGLSDTGIEHRFRDAEGDEIDVLVIDPDRTPLHDIPVGDGDVIHAVGLPEAVRAAQPIAVDSCVVPAARLSLLIAAKLHVASSGARPHDLEDACAAMGEYETQGTRRFDLDWDLARDVTLETAGAYLAARDASEWLEPATLEIVQASVDRLLIQDPRLTERFAAGAEQRALVHAYRTGLSASR